MTRRTIRPVLMGLAIPVVFVGGLAWLTYARVRQERLNRALIERIGVFNPQQGTDGKDRATALASLLRRGADPNVRVSPRETSCLRCHQGRPNRPGRMSPGYLVELLLGRRPGQQRGQQGSPALIVAMKHYDPALANTLLEYGADANVTDADGTSALVVAAELKEVDVVRALLRHGVKDVNDKDPWVAATMSHPLVLSWNAHGEPLLCWAVAWEQTDIVRLLLDRRADVNARDDEGRTALMWAAYVLDADMTRLLLEHGADVTVRDKHGDTALHVARKLQARGVPEADRVIALLKQAGAKE